MGRANERTPEQQAIFEMNAKAINLPQKVKVYQDQLHNIAEHVYISDKLNGINGLYRVNNGSLTLYSRGGLPYPELPHLTDDIMHLMQSNDLTALNVELYIHGTHLQDIQSAVLVHSTPSKTNTYQ